jgi:plastocyanin
MSLNINMIHVMVVVPMLLMVAFNKFPRNNFVTQQQFFVALACLVFLYHARSWYNKQNAVTTVVETPTVVEEVISLEENSANIHHVRVFDSDPGFSQPSLTVNAGDVVVWTNIGESVHSVTAAKRAEGTETGKMEASGEFNSGLMRPGQTFAIKFEQPGWFPYFCLEHRGYAQGEIRVQ